MRAVPGEKPSREALPGEHSDGKKVHSGPTGPGGAALHSPCKAVSGLSRAL